MACLLLACGPSGSPTTTPEPPTPAGAESAPTVSAAAALPSPAVSPRPVMASPTPLLGRPMPGELPPGTASLTYIPESGLPTSVEPLEATCTRIGDSLGLFGQSLRGPHIGRYQLTIAPFSGAGVYRNDATSAQIGGSVSITGLLQLFVAPPFETTAEIAADGALGRLRFSGTGVDGKRADGSIRWECAEIKPG